MGVSKPVGVISQATWDVCLFFSIRVFVHFVVHLSGSLSGVEIRLDPKSPRTPKWGRSEGEFGRCKESKIDAIIAEQGMEILSPSGNYSNLSFCEGKTN